MMSITMRVDFCFICTDNREVRRMIIEIDFNSDEALYLQLRNQIILGIATSQFQEGDSLPSVRQLADTIGINMHTVNKAYTVLKQEGYVKVDRRRGAVIAVDADRVQAMEELKRELQVILAKSSCRNISAEEIHALIDEIYSEYT
jgi:DNA-binding transcriptional regulator YhcF (GntR family)